MYSSPLWDVFNNKVSAEDGNKESFEEEREKALLAIHWDQMIIHPITVKTRAIMENNPR